MAHVLEHRDIESHGLKLIVQKQGSLLLKDVVNYTLIMTKAAQTLTLWGCTAYLYIPYKGIPLGTLR